MSIKFSVFHQYAARNFQKSVVAYITKFSFLDLRFGLSVDHQSASQSSGPTALCIIKIKENTKIKKRKK